MCLIYRDKYLVVEQNKISKHVFVWAFTGQDGHMAQNKHV